MKTKEIISASPQAKENPKGYTPREMTEILADKFGICEMLEANNYQVVGTPNQLSYWELTVSIPSVCDTAIRVSDFGRGEDILDADCGEPLYQA